MPTIRQFLVARGEATGAGRDFDLRLLVIRKQVEKAILGDDLSAQSDLYICSLSSKTIVYKGLIMARQLSGFYNDLNDEDMITAFALVHSAFLHQHAGSMEACSPVQVHHSQRRDQHPPGQHQLDDRPGEELRVRYSRRRSQQDHAGRHASAKRHRHPGQRA